MSSSNNGEKTLDRPFLSHPDSNGGAVIEDGATPLLDHLDAVATAASENGPDALGDLAWYAGCFHDFGKATHYFQEYLIGERTQSKKTNHADISALAAYYALDGTLTDTERLIIFFAIYYHHQHLDQASAQSIEDKLLTHENKTATHEVLTAKAESLQANAGQLQSVYDDLLTGTDIEFSVDAFCEWIHEKEYCKLPYSQLDQFTIVDTHGDRALDSTIVYSCLRAGDIQVTAGHDRRDRADLYTGAITEHINNLETNEGGSTTYDPVPFHGTLRKPPEIRDDTSIEELRGIARREIQYRVENAPDTTRFYDIQLPTGLGKTLSGIEAAARLRNKERGQTDPPRIIYAMPQTAIIDQNHEVVKEAITDGVGEPDCTQSLGRTPTPRHLLKHHHLSDETHATADRSYGDYKDEKHLTNQWDSEIVTTTFVQLIESLTVPSKKQTHRIGSLKNAVIVLDEVQTLPAKYWQIISETLEHYATQLNWDVITMTATDPKVTPDSYSLVDRDDQYYEAVDRVEYHVTDSIKRGGKGEAWDVERVSEFALQQFTKESVDSVLCIRNTIDQAKTLYEEVKSRTLATDDEIDLVYLSSNIPPEERRDRIQHLTRKKSQSSNTMIVSTQVVEAGVDLSTDCVIREIAPLDSIVQAAGRCNRNGEQEKGTVHIVKTETESSPETLLYGAEPIDQTRSLLSGSDSPMISDDTLTNELLPQYYGKLKSAKITDKGIDSLHEWRFRDAAIQLIETPATVDVFIEQDQQDTALRDEYETAYTSGKWDRVEELKPAFQDRVVSLNIYHEESDGVIVKDRLRPLCDDPNEDIVILDVRDPRYTEWYDQETGIEPPEDTVGGRII